MTTIMTVLVARVSETGSIRLGHARAAGPKAASCLCGKPSHLFLRPTGLAGGLALKEQRYA